MLKPKRVHSYGSYPWSIVDEHGQTVEGPPRPFDHPQLGQILAPGARFFQRKKDAQACIDEITRRLADGSLRWKDPT